MSVSPEHSPLIPSVVIQSDGSDDNIPPRNKLKTYKRRWYILGMFTAIGLVCNMEWNTWGPICTPCQIVFGWENWQVLFLTSWAAISMILSAFPSTWIIDTKGLRAAVLLCSFLLTAGKALQIIPSSNILTRTILINTGQFIAMLSCPVGLGAPPSISATWFPPEQRTTATAISTLFAYLGLALAFLIGPSMVRTVELINTDMNSTSNVSITNHTEYDVQLMSTSITNYMTLQLGISALLFICVLFYFPNKPPSPPSHSSDLGHYDYREGVVKLLCDRSYLHLAVLFGISFGVYFGWMSVLSLAVKPFGIDESLAGWLGCSATIAGICSGICLSRFVDYAKRKTKTVLIVLFLGTSISLLLFSLTCSNIIPFSKALLFGSIVFSGLFFNGTTPLLFEMAIEAVYPVAEGVTAIILFVFANVVYLSLMVAFMFPAVNVKWMNWVTVVLTGLCVPGLLLYKNKFKRLDVDLTD